MNFRIYLIHSTVWETELKVLTIPVFSCIRLSDGQLILMKMLPLYNRLKLKWEIFRQFGQRGQKWKERNPIYVDLAHLRVEGCNLSSYDYWKFREISFQNECMKSKWVQITVTWTCFNMARRSSVETPVHFKGRILIVVNLHNLDYPPFSPTQQDSICCNKSAWSNWPKTALRDTSRSYPMLHHSDNLFDIPKYIKEDHMCHQPLIMDCSSGECVRPLSLQTLRSIQQGTKLSQLYLLFIPFP